MKKKFSVFMIVIFLFSVLAFSYSIPNVNARSGIAIAPGCYKLGVNGNCITDYHLINESVLFYDFRIYNYDNNTKKFRIFSEQYEDKINVYPKEISLGMHVMGQDCRDSDGCASFTVGIDPADFFPGKYNFNFIAETVAGTGTLTLKQQVVGRVVLGLVENYSEMNEKVAEQVVQQQVLPKKKFSAEQEKNVVTVEAAQYETKTASLSSYWPWLLALLLIIIAILIILRYVYPLRVRSKIDVKRAKNILSIKVKNMCAMRQIYEFALVCKFKDSVKIANVKLNRTDLKVVSSDHKNSNFLDFIGKVVKEDTVLQLDNYLVIFCKRKMPFGNKLKVKVEFIHDEFDKDDKKEYVKVDYALLTGVDKIFDEIDPELLEKLDKLENLKYHNIKHHDTEGLLRIMRKELGHLHLSNFVLCEEALKIMVKNRRFNKLKFLFKVFKDLIDENAKED